MGSRRLFLLHPLFFLLISSSASSQSSSNVSLGSSLVAGGNKSWVSPSGHFAFGFYNYSVSSDDGYYLLAIWYDRIPEKTVVWTANSNNPVRAGSKVDLTDDGRLQLRSNGKVTWSANTSSTADYGAILDTGNFILVRGNKSFSIWETFQYPTDTFLPSQVIFFFFDLILR